MTTSSSALIDSVAGIVEAVLRRVSGPVEVVDWALSIVLDLAASAASTLPASILIAVVGLLAWSGRRIVRAVVMVLALQLIVLSGLWTSFVTTVFLGAVAGAIGVMLARGVVRGVRAIPRRLRWVSQLGAGVTVSMVAVAVVAITALFGSAVQPAWTLIVILMAAGLAVTGRSLERRGSTWQRLGLGALEQGIAAALLVGTVSGAGLGGLAARAATTGDIALSLQVLLAMTGLAVALVAAAARNVQVAEEATDDDSGDSSLNPNLARDRL